MDFVFFVMVLAFGFLTSVGLFEFWGKSRRDKRRQEDLTRAYEEAVKIRTFDRSYEPGERK